MAPTVFSWRLVVFRDLDRIQTCNLLSRNQMRYSVAPRGRFILLLFNGCKYTTFFRSLKHETENFTFIYSIFANCL